MGDDFDTCEICDKHAAIESMTSCGDGGWMCPACAAERAKEFAACNHSWQPARDEYGDPGQYCIRCGHIVLDENFEGLFGVPPHALTPPKEGGE